MKSWKIASLSLAATVLLAACGGAESESSSANNGGELIVSTFALSEDVIDRKSVV